MTTFGLIWSGAVLAILAGGLATYKLLRLLRKRYPQIWLDLGEPIMFLNTTFKNQRKLSAFVWTGEHKKLDDTRVRRQVLIIRISAVPAAVLLIITVALFFYGAPGSGGAQLIGDEWLGAWSVLGVLFLAGIAQFLMLRRLRDRHPDVWRNLAGTSVPWNMSIRGQGRVIRFEWSGQHRTLEDPLLTTLVYLVRILSLAVVLVWMLSIAWLP